MNKGEPNIGKAPFIGISRHRLGVDGHGVTTLVAFHGCPLRCQYCLNRQCWESDGIRFSLTPEELLERVKIDHLYFLATNGGICFGGGEPALRYKFIRRFRELAPKEWRFTIESSLNVPPEAIESLIPIIDEWIIDIKDMDMKVYTDYTGSNNLYVHRNLESLVKARTNYMIRVPIIPDFNSDTDIERSIELLKSMGFTRFDRFKYVTNLKNK